jgi:hypothetical protein
LKQSREIEKVERKWREKGKYMRENTTEIVLRVERK